MYNLTEEDIAIIEDNKDLIKVVINSKNYGLQHSSDKAKPIIEIYEKITGLKLNTNCSDCIKDAFIIVQSKYRQHG